MDTNTADVKHYYSNQKWLANIFIVLGGLVFMAGIAINNLTLFVATAMSLFYAYRFKQPLLILNQDTFSFKAVPLHRMTEINYKDLINVSIEGKKLLLHFENDKQKFIHAISETTKQAMKTGLNERIQ
jgi:hypothetical protein